MKKINTIILFSATYLLFSCGNDTKQQPREIVEPVNKLTPAAIKRNPVSSSKALKVSQEIKAKAPANDKNAFAIHKEIEIKALPASKTIAEHPKPEIKKVAKEELLTFVNVRKILDKCKMGQTLSQKQLTQNFDIPEEAVKLVKTVTKTAENELAVKWQSTWLVEKVSDAELEDGKMKVTFRANRMYTSGNAIGIKYNRKTYTNLIIIGRSAYIPSVKGYSWQIGK